MMTRPPIRVLVADDSYTMRRALVAMFETQSGIEVVGQASDGMEALRLARSLRPDVITMDVLMPRLDGIGAITAIMSEAPSRILVVSSVSRDQMDLSFRAMTAGALEVISKPSQQAPEELERWGKRVAESIKLMAEVPVVTRRGAGVNSGNIGRTLAPGPVDAIGIAASTGGPPVLAQLLERLPANMGVPVLIAQHIARGFGEGLVRWFQQVSGPKVEMAIRGNKAQAGTVYLAPDGCDLEIDSGGMLRTPGSTGDPCPSGDRLLSSIARVYGTRSAGVVLTGMGSDGAKGLLAIRSVGGLTMAQEEDSCVVFGMPQAAKQIGATMNMFTLEAIIQALAEIGRCPEGKGSDS